ncbi:MAG: methyltransferase domain-containing protein [Candidatus Eisenbacteria bacterium]|nr:methyltransferase domain-containing protein [Candidatus Eisenbacteria bacterium]
MPQDPDRGSIFSSPCDAAANRKEIAVGTLAFDEHAGKYDSWFQENRNILTSEVRLIARALGKPGRALSIGCGSGLFEMLLKQEFGILIEDGIEPAEGMAEIARKRGMTVAIAPAEEIPHPDAAFETALMNGTPAYFQDLRRPLEEARRILKPGGRLVIGDVPASSSFGMLYKLAGVIGTWDDPHLRKIAPAKPYPVEFVREAHWRSTEEIAEQLQELGFEDLDFAQTLTTHARFADDAPEDPIPGYTKGSYVAIRAVKR